MDTGSINSSPDNDIWFAWLSRLSTIFMFWLFACVVWTINDVGEHNDALQAREIEIFKDECVSRSGHVRHDRWLFGVDVYCSEKSGLEVAYKLSHEARLFLPSLMTNFVFGLHDFEEYYGSILAEAKQKTKQPSGE